jgi:hypothetical protein
MVTLSSIVGFVEILHKWGEEMTNVEIQMTKEARSTETLGGL